MERWLQKQWHTWTLWHSLLLPLSWLFGLLVCCRRLFYRWGCLSSQRLPVPVIIVGNITVGGTGKTPLVVWVAQQLKNAGYHPGIISRGYGRKTKDVRQVVLDSQAIEVGDEPLLIAARTECPVWVGINRVQAAHRLLEVNPECDVIISDDGLQHYALQRDIELLVVDGERGFGNKQLLPAGALREPISRLTTVDAVICNEKNIIDGAFLMTLQSQALINLLTGEIKDIRDVNDQTLHAITGIGHPERFFSRLSRDGLRFTYTAFGDHHLYQADDLAHLQSDTLIMTEKDAVKCKAFAKSTYWYLPVNANIEGDLFAQIKTKLKP